MAIISGSGVISDSADGSFLDASVETLKIGAPALETIVMQGTVAVFTSGGQGGQPPAPNYGSDIFKFPVAASSVTVTDTGGDLSAATYGQAGHSSNDDAFLSGGYNIPPGAITTIGKFPFAISGGTSSSIGNLSIASVFSSSHSSTTEGFTAGGDPHYFNPTPAVRIEKFPFGLSSGTASDIGDLTQQKRGLDGCTSTEEGFVIGGYELGPGTFYTTIDKFPFSISGGTATDVGDLNVGKEYAFGNSSPTDGYSSGGFDGPGFEDVSDIDKFPFSISSGTATNVGNLSETRGKGCAANSTTDAFCMGSSLGPPTNPGGIDKFPFSISSGTATSVGTLGTSTEYVGYRSGHQD